ncbi:MAG: hypothetical protein AB1556_02080 [Bacillota bacterium]
MERAELITLAKKLSLREKLFLISQLTKDLSSYKIEMPKKIVKMKGIIPKNSFPHLQEDLKKNYVRIP